MRVRNLILFTALLTALPAFAQREPVLKQDRKSVV